MKRKILQVCHITKTYGKRTVLDDLNMTLYEGDIYELSGSSGAGKTTLIHMAAGLVYPSDGCLFLFGSRDLVRQRRHVGTVTTPPALYPYMTARENLMVQCKLIPVTNAADHIRTVLMMTGLGETGQTKVRAFSTGMKQKLTIAIALLHFPRLLLLDEPVNGLDADGIREIHDLILRLNRTYHITVLISGHVPGELAGLATRRGILHNGKLSEELPEERTCLHAEFSAK